MLGVSAFVLLLVIELVAFVPSVHAATTPSVLQTKQRGCSSPICSLSFSNSVFAGDELIAGIGLECSTACSSVAFTDSLGTSFTVISESTPITCTGYSGTVYDFLAYGVAGQSGADTISVNWSGSLLSSDGTGFDTMEANEAPFLVSGTNTGISGTPSLSGSLNGAMGDIFVEFLSFTEATSSQPTNCNQSAGSSTGWTIWGGVNSDYGLYNTELTSSNFPYPPFTVTQTNWVDIGAVFGAPEGAPTTTGVICDPGSLVVGTMTTCTATVTDTSSSPTAPTGTVSFAASNSGSFSPSSACTLSSTSSSASACSLTYAPSPGTEGTQTITATYGGDSAHQESSGSSSVSVTQRATTTAVVCAPTTVALLHPTTCTATATDTSAGTPITPTGSVGWTKNGDGTFGATSCTLTGTGATAGCSVTFSDPISKSGVTQITTSYAGDTDHTGSTGSTQIHHTL